MDTKEMQGHAECGDCRVCGHGHWKHVLINILVALFIFWIGVQVGELKGILRASYGYGMTGLYGDRGQAYYYGGPGMMSGWLRGTVTQSTTTSSK